MTKEKCNKLRFTRKTPRDRHMEEHKKDETKNGIERVLSECLFSLS